MSFKTIATQSKSLNSAVSLDKDEIMFLYKFIKGECPMSFGLNVARMAHIPQCVLDVAKKKSAEFN